MNENHLQQIFVNYIERFEELNRKPNEEYYKWQIAKQFRPLMDELLESREAAFTAKLKEIKKITGNFIDNYTQPLGGLVRFSNEKGEWKTVQNMFRELYADDDGDLAIRQKKIERFLEKSHQLRERYAPKSYLYKDDFHSVTGYLFLYDPDHNYIYKATHAQAFADCVEFYDDFGSGNHVSLKNYYRMCDHLVKAIKANEAVMATAESRFDDGWGVDPRTLYPDKEKHILAFDIIYCCSTYNLFRGITYVRPKTKERQLIQEKREKAKIFLEQLEAARLRQSEWNDAAKYVDEILCTGTEVRHKNFGKGKITRGNKNTITIQFENNTELTMGRLESVAGGFITLVDEEVANRLDTQKAILRDKSNIENAVSYAEKQFASYSEYV